MLYGFTGWFVVVFSSDVISMSHTDLLSNIVTNIVHF